MSEEIVEAAKLAAQDLSEARSEARTQAVAAIRALEAKLSDVLGTERLRGLPNLGTREVPFFAARVVPSRSNLGKLPPDGREVLALGPDGKLLVVWAFRGKIESRTVRDEELVIEDVEPIARLVSEVLERFVALCERRTEKIEEAGRLSAKLIALLDPS